MKILVTNDDGIYSPGLLALAEAATGFGAVTVMAPDTEQSSMSHAITHSRPLSFRTAPVHFPGGELFRVNGTPADCVALGTHVNANTDLVLSGINMGYNLGHSCWHSGTLAAAKQAVLLGITGVALSTTVTRQGPDWERLRPFVKEVLDLLSAVQGPGLFNVNFPPNPEKIVWTKQDTRKYDGVVMPGMDPMGRKHYWFTVVPLEPAEEGTDRWAVERGWVSITPLRMDLTDYGYLERELSKG